ncbi:unnamed protein product [Sphacelaria rigidula]
MSDVAEAVALLSLLWASWVGFVSIAEGPFDIVLSFIMGLVLLYFTAFCFSTPPCGIEIRSRRAIRRAPQGGSSREDRSTSADMSWRRRGWLVVLRARARQELPLPSTLPRWNLTAVSRRLSATVRSLRATRQSPTIDRAALREDDSAASPLGSTQADATGSLHQAVSTVVHLPEEGIFRNIILHL